MPYNTPEEAVEDLNAQTYQFPPHVVQVRGLDKEGISYIGMPINFEEIVKKIWSDAQSAKVKTERQFILNVLDGIDQADKEMGNMGGGTKAIRLALSSRLT